MMVFKGSMIQPAIWIRLPKTAGTSLKWFLLYGDRQVDEHIMADPNLFNEIKEGLYLTTKPSDSKIVMIETNRPYESKAVNTFREKYSDFFASAWKFTFVRNPWDKYVSAWRYLKSTMDLPFEVVVQNPPSKDDHKEDYNHMTRSQLEVIQDDDGDLIVDDIFKVEDMPNALQVIANRTGIPISTLPRLRTTDHEQYRKYYTKETMEIIAQRYAKEIEMFEYQF